MVVSFDRSFDYDKLTRAYRAVNAGAVIVATNPDPYCPTPDGGLPDCAAMLAALEACTGARAEAIVGKPSRQMAEAFLDRLGVPAERAAVVGDRLMTDVAMGQRLGMAGSWCCPARRPSPPGISDRSCPTTVIAGLTDRSPHHRPAGGREPADAAH